MKNSTSLDVPNLIGGAAIGFFLSATAFYFFSEEPPAVLAAKCAEKHAADVLASALGPPEYAADLPEVVEVNPEGEAKIKWNSVSGARKYLVLLKDSEGKTIKTRFSTRKFIIFKDLTSENLIKEYSVSIATINFSGIAGPFGDSRKIVVKDYEGVTAPDVKVIRVED